MRVHSWQVLQDLGHHHIDVLKMDIEGKEFELMADGEASDGSLPSQVILSLQLAACACA